MDVQYKRMEISVKRVFGADMGQITGEGLLLYLRTVAICYVIAAPIGWLVVKYYLQQFAHRVGFMPSVFLLALVIVGCGPALRRRGAVSLSQDRQDESGGDAEE